MAPQQISLRTIMWHDQTWTSRTADAQWLYMTILADPWTTSAGISPRMIRRWSNNAAGVSIERVEAALDDLVAGGRAVIDDATFREWVLLPKFLVDTGSSLSPNVIKGAIKAAAACDSASIKAAFAGVIGSLPTAAASSSPSTRRVIPPAIRLAVYERDLWTCQDCVRRIPALTAEERRGLNAPRDDEGWLELDHIVPWSLGGPDTEKNLRALCSRCNRVKGAQVELGLHDKVAT